MKHFLFTFIFLFAFVSLSAQVSKRISSIALEDRGESSTVSFSYDDQGRIASSVFSTKRGNQFTTFSYSDNTITMDVTQTFERPDIQKTVVHLDGDGRVSSFDQYSDLPSTNFAEYLVSYDDDGHISKLERNNSSGKAMLFTWKGDIIGGMVYQYRSDDEVYNYEYSEYDNPSTNFYYIELLADHRFPEMAKISPLLYLGRLFGKRPEKLVSKVSEDGYIVDYEYVLDNDGDILELKSITSSKRIDRALFTYEEISGIDSVVADNQTGGHVRYSLSGQLISGSYQGIALVKGSDGKYRKVMSMRR